MGEPAPSIQLRVVPPAGDPFDVRPEGERLVLGRSLDCDLVIADAFLSRRHAVLHRRDEAWVIEDLGSRNGTRVNGELVRQPRPLASGDVVALSGTVVEVQERADLDTPAAALTPSPLPPVSSEVGDATYLLPASDLLAESRQLPARTADGDDLSRWADRLRLVNEVHRALAASLDLDELLEGFLDRVFDHLRPERGVVYLERPEGHPDGPGYYLAARRAVGADEEVLRSESLLREVAGKGLAALVLDAENDERFADSESLLDFGVRSLVAAPLFHGEGSIGMIALDSRIGIRQFHKPDLELLVSLASAAALRLRNLALAEESAERRRLESELALARRIQVNLLPDRLPELPGWQLHGANLPSRGVSGDFYQLVERQSAESARELFAVVADVSGKGMAASLLTASLEALMAPLIEEGLPPTEIATRVGRLLYRRTPPEKYATAFLAAIDLEAGRVRWASAGHNPGLLVHPDGSVEELAATGPPLAILPEADYEDAEVLLAPGDVLVVYTDGLDEAMDGEGEEYGLERLTRVCARERGADLATLAKAIERDLEGFVEGMPFADDRTLLLLRRV